MPTYDQQVENGTYVDAVTTLDEIARLAIYAREVLVASDKPQAQEAVLLITDAVAKVENAARRLDLLIAWPATVAAVREGQRESDAT